LDDDTVCPPHNLCKDQNIFDLVKVGHPLISGIYMAKKRRNERGLAAWMKHPNNMGYIPIDMKQSARYVEVDVAGLGCCMIQRWIFEQLPEPWFKWDIPPGVSEDFYFFEKCAKSFTYEVQGVVKPLRPVVDMEMKCRHIGLYISDTDGTFDLPEI
jgi:hypothetical protein